MLVDSGCITSIALGVAAAGAYNDVRTGTIPNWLTLGSLAAAPLLWFGITTATEGAHAGLSAAGLSFLGAILCGIGPAFFFYRKSMGGGDVKLFAALGALLGPRVGIDAEFYAFVVAALYVPARLAWHGQLFHSLRLVSKRFLSRFSPSMRASLEPAQEPQRLRLGPAIFVGTFCAFLLTTMGGGA